MVKGKTSSGFSFEVDADVLNDAEFLETLTQVQKGDVGESFALIAKILGAEQKKALYDHVRNKKGFVPADKIAEEIADILAALSEDESTKK